MHDVLPNIAPAPEWSLWVGQLGKGCIWSAILLFGLTVVLGLVQKKNPVLERPSRYAFVLGCLSLFGAFACLGLLFVKDQFQFEYVWEHGDSTTELKYKIAGIWTAQQGSFLLWACTSALFALLTVRGTGPYRRWYTVVYSGFLASVAGILAYETPFNVLKGASIHGKLMMPPNGAGMTPSLQNYWVVIHPPTIFLGFGSLTVFFAYAVAAMLERNASDWVSRVRPWALLTTGILGLGICMGGMWAYETQGWGGFWAWDPVENVSFVPWLFTVVLAHGVLVQVTRGKWLGANLFLGGLPFVSFVFGTFLTRSGLLDNVSVHSFASMDKNALIILRWFLIAVTAAFILLWAMVGRSVAAEASPAASEPELAGAHREGFYRFGMLLLSMTAVVITIGMSWPVVAALRGGQGSKVEEWLYHLVVVWFFIPIMLLMAIAPFVGWRPMGWDVLGNRLFTVVCITFGLTGFLQMALMSPIGVHPEPGATVAGPFGIHVPLTMWMLVLTFLCVFVLVGNVWRISEIVRRSPTGVGGFIAHAGMAVLMGGLILSRGYERKETVFVRPNSPAVALGGYLISYVGREHDADPFDRDGKVVFEVQRPDGSKFIAKPGLYKYGSEDDPKDMVWPHVEHSPSHDIYLSMAPPDYLAWRDPVTLKPGDIQTVGDTTIEYLKPDIKGKFGTVGVTFGAQLRLTTDGADHERHQYLATPSVRLGEQGLEPSVPTIGPDYRIAMIGGMNAEDKAVTLMLFFNPPIYPIELFYKPLTGLVWLGAGLLTLGGLLSAWSRRKVSAPQVETEIEQDPQTAKDSQITAPPLRPAAENL